MTTTNEEQVAPAPETQRVAESNVATDEIRDKDAYIKALEEGRDRTATKLAEYQRLKLAEDERKQRELEQKGEWEKLSQAHKSELKSYKTRLENVLKRNAAGMAIASAGITDPDVAAMACTHLLNTVDAKVDLDTSVVDADYAKAAKALAKSLVPKVEKETKVVGLPPKASVSPSVEENWRDRLVRGMKAGQRR